MSPFMRLFFFLFNMTLRFACGGCVGVADDDADCLQAMWTNNDFYKKAHKYNVFY